MARKDALESHRASATDSRKRTDAASRGAFERNARVIHDSQRRQHIVVASIIALTVFILIAASLFFKPSDSATANGTPGQASPAALEAAKTGTDVEGDTNDPAPTEALATQTAPEPERALAAQTAPAPETTPAAPAAAQEMAAASPDATRDKLDAYRGLGAWVDVWDEKALADPAGAVRSMAENGVKTIFLETGNSKTRSAVMHKKELSIFIREAHARDMYVVAWYLPHFKSVSHDAKRVEEGLRFKTPDGQTFDGFALDIESPAVKNVSVRNGRLKKLTGEIRKMVGPDYPLGAIIPSPLDTAGGYWRELPYEFIAENYDVYLPMSYYTFRVNGASRVRERTIADVELLRTRPGSADMPIHMIGGLSNKSSASETQAFVDAVKTTKVMGGSIYLWSGTSAGDRRALKGLAR